MTATARERVKACAILLHLFWKKSRHFLFQPTEKKIEYFKSLIKASCLEVIYKYGFVLKLYQTEQKGSIRKRVCCYVFMVLESNLCANVGVKVNWNVLLAFNGADRTKIINHFKIN